MKYIDAEKLKAEIKRHIKHYENSDRDEFKNGELYICQELLSFVKSLQHEQPDFPTTDEEIEIFLATHPKVEVPQKYKTPDWLWKKHEQSEVDLVTEYDEQFYSDPVYGKLVNRNAGMAIARHFYELGLKAKEENK